MISLVLRTGLALGLAAGLALPALADKAETIDGPVLQIEDTALMQDDTAKVSTPIDDDDISLSSDPFGRSCGTHADSPSS